MTPEQKKRRYRELAQHDRIRTARELAEQLEQPFLPLFNDCPDVQAKKSGRRGQSGGSHHGLRAD
jgi:hypothetical protein